MFTDSAYFPLIFQLFSAGPVLQGKVKQKNHKSVYNCLLQRIPIEQYFDVCAVNSVHLSNLQSTFEGHKDGRQI